MARNQTFHPRHQQGHRPRDTGQPYGDENQWRSRYAREDHFSARDHQGGSQENRAWDEDRYGYPEATSYGREMNRARGGYAPEGRFAYDPYEQQQRSFEFSRSGQSWPRDPGGRGGQDWSSAQFGSGQYLRDGPRDLQQGYSQDFGGRVQNPGGWNGQRDAWRGQPQHNWTEEITPYSGWRDQPSGSPGQDFSPRKTPKGYTRSDERIRDDVCEHLYRSHDVDVGDVSVEVKGGTVTLEGSVPERHMKHRIEDICERCIGVLDVENRIRVSRGDTQQNPGATESGDHERSNRKGPSARH
ncbi:MAG TPA: BON domain-containing protein [Solimonas sp.]